MPQKRLLFFFEELFFKVIPSKSALLCGFGMHLDATSKEPPFCEGLTLSQYSSEEDAGTELQMRNSWDSLSINDSVRSLIANSLPRFLGPQ